MNATTLQTRLPLVGFLFAVLAKFWLIWETEITDALDDPHEYVLQILYPVNGGLAYGPGTGMVGRFFHDLGIPFRLGIEAVFILACVLVLRALLAWPWKSWFSLGLFLVVTFDPAMVELFSHLYSDQIWLVEMMIGLACIVLALQNESRPNWILLNLAAVSLGLATLTRSVFIPLMAGLALFTLLGLSLTYLQKRDAKAPRLSLLALAMASLFLIIGIIYEGTCWYNSRCYGYYGISAIDCSEFKTLYFCLQSVGEPTGPRYYPIDENRRNLIAQAGPASRQFMSGMNHNDYLKKVGLENYGTADIAAGWLEFATFNEAYARSGGDLRQCFALFKTVEDEIADANRRGVLKTRSVLPLPDTRISIVAAAYPDALWETLRQIGHEPSSALLVWNSQAAYSNPEFTTALHRRTIHESPVRDEIWHLLCPIYAVLYAPTFLYLLVTIGAGLVIVAKWNRHEVVSLATLARQLFALFSLGFIAWYALFAASGWPALSRYTVFEHVMLPILMAYYLIAAWRLLRPKPHARL